MALRNIYFSFISATVGITRSQIKPLPKIWPTQQNVLNSFLVESRTFRDPLLKCTLPWLLLEKIEVLCPLNYLSEFKVVLLLGWMPINVWELSMLRFLDHNFERRCFYSILNDISAKQTHTLSAKDLNLTHQIYFRCC